MAVSHDNLGEFAKSFKGSNFTLLFIYKDRITVNVPVLASLLIFSCSYVAGCYETSKKRKSTKQRDTTKTETVQTNRDTQAEHKPCTAARSSKASTQHKNIV